jgi:hypothetical protein
VNIWWTADNARPRAETTSRLERVGDLVDHALVGVVLGQHLPELALTGVARR